MNTAQNTECKMSKVFLAVAFTSYLELVAGIVSGSPVSAVLSQMDIGVGTALFFMLPLFAVVGTFFECWIPCAVMLNAKDDNSRISRAVISAVVLLGINLVSIFSVTEGMMHIALISGMYNVLVCVVLPYLYFFSYPTYENASLTKTRFFKISFILFLLGCMDTLSKTGFVHFTDLYDALIRAAFLLSILIKFFLIPFILVLFAKFEQKTPMAIGAILVVGLIDFLSGEGLFFSVIDAIIYVALPCCYVFALFGLFGSKTEYRAFLPQYR